LVEVVGVCGGGCGGGGGGGGGGGQRTRDKIKGTRIILIGQLVSFVLCRSLLIYVVLF